MPRQARERSECGIYHVMLRGNNKQVVFEDDQDRAKFISILKESQTRDGKDCFSIYSYCLMSNHVHLLYRERDEAVEQSIKRIGVTYAMYFNAKYGRVGHLFQGRYRSEPCNDVEYFMTLIRYIHQNPVKAFVSDAIDYQWSSWHEFANPGNAEVCDVQTILKRFPIDVLKSMMQEMLPEDTDCLDVETKPKPRKKSDDYLHEVVGKLFPDTDITSLEMAERKVVVRSLVEKGFAVSQIARAMGLSYDQVFNVIRVRRRCQ